MTGLGSRELFWELLLILVPTNTEPATTIDSSSINTNF